MQPAHEGCGETASRISLRRRPALGLQMGLLVLDDSKIFCGYCLAVTAATLPFTVLTMLSIVSEFESATSFSLETKILHFAVLMILLQLASWIFVFSFVAIPFFITINMFRRCDIHGCWIHVIAGTVTAMLIGPLGSFLNLGINVTEPQPSEGYLMLFFAPFGAVAGLVFWRFARLKMPGGE
jgi:hypothetical protein